MNVFIVRKIKGMTLIELMISIALFVMMAAVAAYTISSGIRAHNFDRRVRNAQTAARDVITKLCNEMRCATSAPTSSGVPIPTGVLYPDSYGDDISKEKTKFSDSAFYGVGTDYIGGTAESNKIYFSKNRVIFIRPKTAITTLDSNTIAGESFNPQNANEYVFVEWYVPVETQNKVYRRVYKYQSGSVSGIAGISSGGVTHVLVDPTYFDGVSYLVATAAALSGGDDKYLVGSLDGEFDSFDLRVYHARYIYPGSNAPGTEVPYGTAYDRNLYTVELNTRVMKGKEHAYQDTATQRYTSSHKDYSEASLTQQVHIQSGL